MFKKKQINLTNIQYLFIDLKNGYDKVIHIKLFEKLKDYNIDSNIINTIKLLYSYGKIKISNNSEIINVNNDYYKVV